MNAFKPEGATLKVTVSGTASAGTRLTEAADAVRIANTGSAIVWVKFGSTAPTATNADYPVPAGLCEVIRPGISGPLWVSVIAVGATGDIYLTPGSGV